MYYWNMIMNNGNVYIAESDKNTVRAFMTQVFGEGLTENTYGIIKLKDTNEEAVVNLKYLSEITYKRYGSLKFIK